MGQLMDNHANLSTMHELTPKIQNKIGHKRARQDQKRTITKPQIPKNRQRQYTVVHRCPRLPLEHIVQMPELSYTTSTPSAPNDPLRAVHHVTSIATTALHYLTSTVHIRVTGAT